MRTNAWGFGIVVGLLVWSVSLTLQAAALPSGLLVEDTERYFSNRFVWRPNARCKAVDRYDRYCSVYTVRNIAEADQIVDVWMAYRPVPGLVRFNAHVWSPARSAFVEPNVGVRLQHGAYPSFAHEWAEPETYPPATPITRLQTWEGMPSGPFTYLFAYGTEVWTDCSRNVPAIAGPGDPAENFWLLNQRGGTTELCDLLGKPVILYIFDAWCGHCWDEYVRLATEFWPQNRNAGFNVVVVVNDPGAGWPQTTFGWPDIPAIQRALRDIDARGADNNFPVLADISHRQRAQYVISDAELAEDEGAAPLAVAQVVVIDENMKIYYSGNCGMECAFGKILELLRQ